MEMASESNHHRWYESPRVNSSSSPGQNTTGGSGQISGTPIEGGTNSASSSELNASVAEHMGAFFLDPSVGHQRAAARYYHQSMHGPYAGVGSHGKFLSILFRLDNYKLCQSLKSFILKLNDFGK